MNWENYDDVLEQLRSAGLVVDAIDVGRLVRCRVDDDREKRGWYSLHELRLDSGGHLLVGTFGVWRGADAGTQKIELKRRQLSDDQRRALKARIDADRKAANEERQRVAARAAVRARAAWERCTEQGDHPYLERKHVGAHGVRFSPRGGLVVPMLDVQGRIHGLQVIHARQRHGRDKDYWPAGLAKQGHFFQMGPMPGPGAVILLGEGYATAASLFEATGLATVVAFDAGNMPAVAIELHRRHPRARILACVDDDHVGKCGACGKYTPVAELACMHCGEPHGKTNAGLNAGNAVALATGGAWLAPVFAAERAKDSKGDTDFNDLHAAEGLQSVRAQVEARIRQLRWHLAEAPRASNGGGGSGGGGDGSLQPIESVDELHERFALVYEMPDTVFDDQEHKLVPLSSMRNACVSRMIHRSWMESRTKRIVREGEVGFDPAGEDRRIRCNLWGGWPTVPVAGVCDKLLELLRFLCSHEADGGVAYEWSLKWLAYPLQHPGAKMKTALVFHGPQGAGKNAFFDAYAGIYGEYGRMIGQAAVEDKFNDWASRKLCLIANEVVSRSEVYHVKNALKSLITDDWIRINPKNVGAHDERNHVNLVFLSNEVMPVALERDDRRYMVVWTPKKKAPDFYAALRAEIAAGGIAALHHYLLQLDLQSFEPGTLPPVTAAKQDLIDLGMDSIERFYVEWTKHYLELPIVAVRSEDLYDAYRHWCMRYGVHKPASFTIFVGNIGKYDGVRRGRARVYVDGSDIVDRQVSYVLPHPYAADNPTPSKRTLSDAIDNFAASLERWKGAYRRGNSAREEAA